MIRAGASKSVVLADVQDNPGAGATCDTTGLIAALVAEGVPDAAVCALYDPETARLAHQAGEGATLERSEEHTSELQSLMRISSAVFCLKKKILRMYNASYE